jgi:hypothetical protein
MVNHFVGRALGVEAEFAVAQLVIGNQHRDEMKLAGQAVQRTVGFDRDFFMQLGEFDVAFGQVVRIKSGPWTSPLKICVLLRRFVCSNLDTAYGYVNWRVAI